MTFFDFLDKHWGFWFGWFLLMLAGSVAHGLAHCSASSSSCFAADRREGRLSDVREGRNLKREVLADGVEIWLGDCLEILPQLKGVGAIVTDPPYGIGFKHAGTNALRRPCRGLHGLADSQSEAIVGDDKPFDPAPFLAAAPRCLFFGAQHFAHHLPPSRHWIVWDKKHARPLSFGSADLAWTNAPGNIRIHRQLWNGCFVEGEERKLRGGSGQTKTRTHPVQKPVALMAFCIERVGGDGAVLDPFMGSGATGCAAIDASRPFIGIEIVEKHFDEARRRLLRRVDLRKQAA